MAVLTNNIGNVKMLAADRKKVKHNFSHKVHSSCNFGEVQPLVNVLLEPHTSNKISIENLVYLAPIVAPVDGDANYEHWHYFVKMTDLTRNFEQMMSQTRVNRGSGITFVPTVLPSIPLALLSWLPFFDSHCTIWYSTQPAGSEYRHWQLHGCTTESYPGNTFADGYLNDLISGGFIVKDGAARIFDGYQGFSLNIYRFCQILCPSVLTTINNVIDSNDLALYCPLNNYYPKNFFDSYDWQQVKDYSVGGVNQAPVYYDVDSDCDATIEFRYNDVSYLFAFRFSDFGKRLYKALIGSGYQLDLSNVESVSLMPLFAYYKAYFDCFGILLYENWEDTTVAKLLNVYDNTNTFDFDCVLNTKAITTSSQHEILRATFQQFIKDLAFCYTTDSVNAISAAQKTANIGLSSRSALLNGVVDVNNDSLQNRIDQGFSCDNTSTLGENGHAFTRTVAHGQLDCEVLKKLYLWTNRNTIAGQRVYELLKAQGLDKWADSQKVNFIGHQSTPVEFSQIFSSADTYKNGDGSQLGERGGRGQAWNGSDDGKYVKTFEYDNDVTGFYIVLAAVVPHSDFCQAIDQRVFCNEKFKFYNPEFDGLGLEMEQKHFVCGSNPHVEESQTSPLNASYGLLPRYSGLKCVNSKINGEFSLGSRKAVYQQYILNKIMDLNQKSVSGEPVEVGDFASNADNSYWVLESADMFKADEIPVAGSYAWRYSSRYPWLSNLDRIFSAVGDDYRRYGQDNLWKYDQKDFRKFYEFMSNCLDGFMLFNTIRWAHYSPMLQLGDSFETSQDGNEGATNMNTSKA